jgi:hypothetical protein
MPFGVFQYEFYPFFENPFWLYSLKCVSKDYWDAFSPKDELLQEMAIEELTKSQKALSDICSEDYNNTITT